MASKKILVQLDIATASDLTSPLSGFVGFSAKDDGLYQKIGTSPELRLLTSADVQNAILADGSITGAVSQAQTFTLGVKLSNLTQGYIPYASGATKLLSNSPIYTDGTNVGIGTTDPGAYKLNVNGNTNITGNLNLSSLTASKVVFTNASKNLTSTGIGTASQFIKGDGSLDSNTYITSGSISGFVPYTGANDDVNLGTHNLSCNEIITASRLTVGNTNASSYTDGGYLSAIAPSDSYAKLSFYSKDTSDGFGITLIIANPEEGISLRAISNDYLSDSYLEVRHWELGFYTNLQKRLEIAQSGSINAFGNTITSTGGFIGNASTATKLQTARTITIGGQSLPFDGTANLTYSLANIGIPTGSGVDGRIAFWSGTDSLSSNSNLLWDNTNSRLTVYSIFSVGSFKLGTNATAGYVLTTDANGNGTWQAPTVGGSYTLPTASSSVLGGVKVGLGLQIDTGVLSVDPSVYIPYVGADRNVNLASYSIYAYDFLIYSDINLKCNIEDIEMKKLDINYKQFEYKTSRGEKRYGVIAQELLSIAPEFVSESNNSYAVKYTDLLIYEVAQLKEEVKQLKSLLCR